MTNLKPSELRESWRNRVAEFRASGLTGAAWCAAHQLKENQLWYWVKKFTDDSTSESQPRFIPVQLHDSTKRPDPSLLVRIGSATIEIKTGYDSDLLRDVARTLTSIC